MPTCRDLTELVTDYLEGRMGLAERVRFRWHLGMCLSCHAYVRQMRRTIALLGELPEEPVPAAVRAELLVRLRGFSRT